MRKIISKTISLIFAMILIYLTIIVAIEKENIFWKFNPIIVIGVAIISFAILLLIYIILSKRNIKHKNVFIISIFIIIVLLQILAFNLFKVEPKWDFGIIYNEAIDFDNDYDTTSYFCRYPNNIPIEIAFKTLFKVCNFIGINNFIEIGAFINILFMDLSIFMLYKVINKYLGSTKALFALIIFLIMPTTYLYTPIFYTDVLSIIFPILILYFYLKIKDTEERNKKLLLCFILGVITFIGMSVKVTICIIEFAICILEIFLHENTKKQFLNIVMYVLIVGFTVLILILTKNFIIKNNYKYYSRMENEKFPVTHWVMMALQGDGRYSEDDAQYTASFKTQNEKVKANVEEIKARINKHNIDNDWFQFINTKVRTTWGDGTFYIPWQLNRSPLNKGQWHEFIIKKGDNTNFYKYYSQGIYLSMLICMIMSLINTKKDKENDIAIVCQLSLIGLFIFFVIWEAKSRYIVNYIPIFVILETIGMSKIYDKIKK